MQRSSVPSSSPELIVPDGDVIRRGVRHSWRSAFRALSAGGAGVDVQGFIGRGLSASLKAHRMPPIGDAATLLGRVWTGAITVADGMRQVAGASGITGGTRANALLDDAIRRAIVAGPTGARPEQAIAEEFCAVTVDTELFSKLRPALLEHGEHTPAEVESIMTDMSQTADPSVRRIAQQLIVDPSAAQLRSPRSRRRRRSTVDLLNESI